jgi:hypothetical protein
MMGGGVLGFGIPGHILLSEVMSRRIRISRRDKIPDASVHPFVFGFKDANLVTSGITVTSTFTVADEIDRNLTIPLSLTSDFTITSLTEIERSIKSDIQVTADLVILLKSYLVFAAVTEASIDFLANLTTTVSEVIDSIAANLQATIDLNAILDVHAQVINEFSAFIETSIDFFANLRTAGLILDLIADLDVDVDMLVSLIRMCWNPSLTEAIEGWHVPKHENKYHIPFHGKKFLIPPNPVNEGE